MTLRTLITLCVGMWMSAVWCSGETVFELQQLSRRDLQVATSSELTSHTVDLDPQEGRLTLRVQGEAGAHAQVTIRLPRPMQAPGEVRFKASTRNLMSTPQQPALYLETASGEYLPVLLPQGGDYQELGRALFGQDETAEQLIGFGLHLQLDEAGMGELQLQELSVDIEGNFLPEARVEQILSEAPNVQSSLSIRARQPLRLTVNGQLLSGIGYAPATGEAMPQVAWNRVRLNLGGGAESLVPYRDYLDRHLMGELLERAQQADTWLLIELEISSAPAWSTTPAAHLSPAWQESCQRIIRQVMAALAVSPHSDRIMAISLRIGHHGTGASWPLAHTQETEQTFRDWLAERYAGVEALREAWNRPSLNLERPIWTPPVADQSGDVFDFIHPMASQENRDRQAFLQETWLSFVLQLSETIKTATSGQLLVGIYGGPAAWANPGTSGQADWSHDTLLGWLNAPSIDLLEVPSALPDPLLLADAAGRRGKLLLIRYRPWQADPIGELRRQFAQAALRPALLEVEEGARFHARQPGLGEALSKLSEVAARLSILDRTEQPQVAIGLGSAVYDVLAPDADDLALLAWPRLSWARSGFPYRVDLVDDLEPESHRLAIYQQALVAGETWLQRAQAARTDGRVQAFTWGTAVVSEDRVSPKSLAQITNLGIRWRPESTRFFLNPLPTMRSEMGIEAIRGYLGWPSQVTQQESGLTYQQGPQFLVDDDDQDVTVLATYPENGQPAMAWRQTDDWTSFYSASPYLNPEILRALADTAGVHCYLESDDKAFFSGRFIALQPDVDGPIELTMPTEETLYEVWREQELEPAEVHRLELTADRSYLFFRGNWDEWINARR